MRRADRAPDYLITPGFGLDVRLPLRDGRETRSARFRADFGELEQAQVEEELRLFYVAVTRAQHQVVLIGSGRDRPLDPDSPYYAWQDEILRVGPRLAPLGAWIGAARRR